MVFARRSLAIGVLDRTMRAVVGLVVGSVVGAIAALLVGVPLAVVWPLPKILALWAGCACGVLTATWSAVRCRWPWFTPVPNPRRRRVTTVVEHGWVDFVVRSVLGVLAGAVGGGMTAGAILVWLEAFGVDTEGSGELAGLEWLLLVASCSLLGAFFGFLWFAIDVPWLPGHRRPKEVASRVEH